MNEVLTESYSIRSNRRTIQSVVPVLLVALAVLFNGVAYWSELSVRAPDANDHVLHRALVQRINDAWDAGGNPRDPWIPYWGQGFALLRYQQHLAHLAVVVVYRLFRGSVALGDVFEAVHFSLLALSPLSFFIGARLLGFAPISAALIALCVPLLGADPQQHYFLGLQAATFTWTGVGLFPQLFALVLFPLAFGALHHAVLHGRRFGPALALLSATWLSHLLVGYIVCVLGVLVLLRPEASGRRRAVLLRLVGLYAATFIVALYLLLPTLLEGQLLNRSVWEGPEYWDSFGMQRVLAALLSGGLLDGVRLPILTLLASWGLLISFIPAMRRRSDDGPARFAGTAFVTAVLVYFGRPTWGALLRVLPFSSQLPMHRWICGVQFAGLLLAGLALGWLWQLVGWHRSRARVAAACALSLTLLSPAVISTWQSASRTAELRSAAAVEYRRNGQGLTELLAEVRRRDAQQPGRAYAGTSWDWGKGYRLADVPVYMYWAPADISAISYMIHTSSLNSDVEVEFDSARKDRYDLFNIRYLFTYDRSLLPPFARLIAERPGIYAATVDTPGYFDIVGADLFFSASGASNKELYEFNRDFVRGPWHAAHHFVRMGWRSSDRPVADERQVTKTTDLPPVDGWQAPRGAVLSSWGHNDHFGAQVLVHDPGYVLLRVTYHPAWRATVDDVPAETVMLSPSFIGIPIQLGTHRVDVRYAPGAWTTVLFYSGMCVLGLVFAADRLRVWPSCRGQLHPPVWRVGLEVMCALVCIGLFLWQTNAPIGGHKSSSPSFRLTAW